MKCNNCTYYQEQMALKKDPVIGFLNRDYGYNYFQPIPKGTTVYEDIKGYYFNMVLVKDGQVLRQYFYKDGGILKHIDRL